MLNALVDPPAMGRKFGSDSQLRHVRTRQHTHTAMATGGAASKDGTSEYTRTHQGIVDAARTLHATESTLRNAVSSHKINTPVTFQSLDSFVTATTQLSGQVKPSQLFLGSLDGDMFVSVRLRPAAPTASASGKKRTRDDCAERAKAACSKLHTMVSKSNDPERNAKQVAYAQATIEQLLRNIKGPGGEEVFESCGVSMANVQDVQASVAASPTPAFTAMRRPKLIIACRLSAGIPLPLVALREALGDSFRDGMITTKPESLGPAYRLPLTEQGTIVERSGQRSMLLFAAVLDPHSDPVS